MKIIFETFFCGFKMLIFQGVMLIFMMQVSYKLLDNTLVMSKWARDGYVPY